VCLRHRNGTTSMRVGQFGTTYAGIGAGVMMTTQQFQQKQELMGPQYKPTMGEVLQVVHANSKKKKSKAKAKANAVKGVVKKGANRLGGKKAG
jgi:hypothetical protein